MNILRSALCLLILALVFADPISAVPAGGGKLSVVPHGDWGGEHISMTVTAEGADIEFDCAIGHIKTPLTLDAGGAFKVKGLYKTERPAAAFVDDSEGIEVFYVGRLKGNSLHLEIEMPGQSEHKKFDLVRGQEPRLNKCA
jgi:hypothetical protein